MMLGVKDPTHYENPTRCMMRGVMYDSEGGGGGFVFLELSDVSTSTWLRTLLGIVVWKREVTVINQVLMGGIWLYGSYMIVLAMTILLVGLLMSLLITVCSGLSFVSYLAVCHNRCSRRSSRRGKEWCGLIAMS